MDVVIVVFVVVSILGMGISIGQHAEANKWRQAARNGFRRSSGGELYEVHTAEQSNSANIAEMMYIGS